MEQHDQAHVLFAEGEPRAIAVFCAPDEPFRSKSQRLGGQSPLSYGFSCAESQDVDWVVLTQDAGNLASPSD